MGDFSSDCIIFVPYMFCRGDEAVCVAGLCRCKDEHHVYMENN